MPKLMIIVGVVLVVVGVLWLTFPNIFSWVGRLPGDIRIEGQRGGFYFPITTMVIISLLMTLVLNLFNR